MEEVLISHVGQQGPLGQIPNTYVEDWMWNANYMCHACRGELKKIGHEKGMHAACIQKRTFGHVKNEKIMLGGRGGSPARLGHLQLRTFISVCYATLILLEMLGVTYVLYSVFTWVNFKSWVISFSFISISGTRFCLFKAAENYQWGQLINKI